MARTRRTRTLRPKDAFVLVIFTDVRGFTPWSDNTEVFARLNEFVADFLKIIRRRFPGDWVKPLGDGAMIVREISPSMTAEESAQLLARVLLTIEEVDEEFHGLCETFAERVGHRNDLHLGWGIVRGAAKKLDGDYVGHNINKCARLCSLARPFGVVIDQNDFPAARASRTYTFYPQTRKVNGLGEIRVWVSEEIGTQFLTRERIRHAPEVHVAGLCIDASNKRALRLLLARRSERRRLFPGLLEGCGGQLAYSETFVEGVARHFRLEMGIEVRVLEDIHLFYAIREPNEPVIPGIRFLCERVGDREPRSVNHSSVEWVPESRFRNIAATEFIPGVKEEFMRLLEEYRRRQRPR